MPGWRIFTHYGPAHNFDLRIMRSAATLVLARDGSSRPELLFVKRLTSLKFLADFHVFPGGALHEEDAGALAHQVSALSAGEAAERMGAAAGDLPALGFFMCAVRELFEETGILLARYRDGSPVPDDAASSARKALETGPATFPQVLHGLGAVASTDLLTFFVRWTAPESLPIRFDARVFIAAGSGNPVPDPNEIASADWQTVADILALAESGEVMLAPPTLATVSSLARFDSVASLVSGDGSVEASPIEGHSSSIRRIIAPNPSVMTGPGTNTYIVGTGPYVVIDPGSMEPAHLRAITSVGEIKAILLTHGHPDHLAGALDLAEMTGAELRASERFWETAQLSAGNGVLSDGHRIEEHGVPILEVVATPGHSSDHLCFWLSQESAMFTGDLVLGEGTSVISPPDGNLADYLRSLERVKSYSPSTLYPGHFDPRTDATSWIDWYISHRLEREIQILDALAPAGSDVAQIVRRVYRDYPESLYPVAERSVMAHLEKLVSEGRVQETKGTFSRPDAQH